MKGLYILSIGDVAIILMSCMGLGLCGGVLISDYFIYKEKQVVNHCFTSTFMDTKTTFHRIECPWEK